MRLLGGGCARQTIPYSERQPVSSGVGLKSKWRECPFDPKTCIFTDRTSGRQKTPWNTQTIPLTFPRSRHTIFRGCRALSDSVPSSGMSWTRVLEPYSHFESVAGAASLSGYRSGEPPKFPVTIWEVKNGKRRPSISRIIISC